MVANLALALDPARFEVSVVSLFTTPSTPLARSLEEARIPVVFLGKSLGFDPLVVARLGATIRRRAPDVLQTHLHAIRYALPSLLLRRRTVRVHTVHAIAKEETNTPFINRLAFAAGVQPVAIAEAVAKSVERVYGISELPIVLNGIPVSRYASPSVPRPDWRRNEGVGEKDFVFVNVARLRAEKNQRLLIRAFAGVARQAPDVWLLVAGDGPLRSELVEAARDAGVSDRTRFLGLREDVPNVLGAADVFVLSSNFEGNPLCVMEAMAAGLPVVSTAVGGVPELVEGSRSGVLVSAGDEAALTDAMLQLCRDADLTAKMGRAASARAREQFDVSVMARGYEALYERSLASRCAPARQDSP